MPDDEHGDSEIFDIAVADRGGRLDIDQFGEDSLFPYHRDQAVRAIRQLAALQPLQPPLSVHFDYVKDGRLNAFAFAVGERHFVGLHGGTIPIVHSLFLQLLSHPSALRHVGDPDREIAPAQHRRPGLVDADTLFQRGGKDGMPLAETLPRDLTRKIYARILATVAIDFLTHHELGHVLYGHVGLLNSRAGTPFIAELDWARPKSLSSLE